MYLSLKTNLIARYFTGNRYFTENSRWVPLNVNSFNTSQWIMDILKVEFQRLL